MICKDQYLSRVYKDLRNWLKRNKTIINNNQHNLLNKWICLVNQLQTSQLHNQVCLVPNNSKHLTPRHLKSHYSVVLLPLIKHNSQVYLERLKNQIHSLHCSVRVSPHLPLYHQLSNQLDKFHYLVALQLSLSGQHNRLHYLVVQLVRLSKRSQLNSCHCLDSHQQVNHSDHRQPLNNQIQVCSAVHQLLPVCNKANNLKVFLVVSQD